MSKLDQVIHFVDGLKQVTKVEVNYKSSNTLKKAIHAAIAYDTARFGPARVYLPSIQSYQQPTNRNYRYRDDSRLRLMKLNQVEINRSISRN